MESYSSLLEAFSALNQRKRCEADLLSDEERDRWRLMRCSLERVLFSCVPKPSDDRREFVRVPIPLRVCYRAADRQGEGLTATLGEGGLFLQDENPLPAGTPVELAITPGNSASCFTIRSEVAWSARRGEPSARGMGLRFVDIDWEQRRFIECIVDGILTQSLTERRRSARVDCWIPVRFRQNAGDFDLFTMDLGADGLFAASEHLMTLGERLRLKLKFPGAPDEAQAEVVRVVEEPAPGLPAGMGLRFLNAEPARPEAIRRHLLSEIRGAGPGVSLSSKRRHPRVQRRFGLRLRTGYDCLAVRCRDISMGGAFVQMHHAPRPGSRVVVEIPPERSRPLLKLQAEVLRAVSPTPARPHQAPGAALLFDAASRERLGLAALLENLVMN